MDPLDAAIQPVDRPVPLRQTVYERLVELIIDGTLQAGQHLGEVDLADRLGVSRQPIREALHHLRAEGWVDLRPGQGAFVHVPTEREVDELFDVRALLEAEAARRAARAATPEAVERLRTALREGFAALEADELGRVVEANAALHTTITAMSGNAMLADLIRLISVRTRWYHRPVAMSRGPESWEEHIALVDAIEARDGELAAEIAHRHTENTRAAYHRHS